MTPCEELTNKKIDEIINEAKSKKADDFVKKFEGFKHEHMRCRYNLVVLI